MEKLNLYELAQTQTALTLPIFEGEITLQIHKISIAQVDGLLCKVSTFLEKIDFKTYQNLEFIEALKKALQDPTLLNDVLDMIYVCLNSTSASLLKGKKKYTLFSREEMACISLEDLILILEFVWENNFSTLLKKMKKTPVTLPETPGVSQQ
jgi:hypothetical protein